MKDKARLIVGGIVIAISITAVTTVAILKPDAVNSIYLIGIVGVAVGYFITT